MECLEIIFKFLCGVIILFFLSTVIGAITLNIMLEKMETEESSEKENGKD